MRRAKAGLLATIALVVVSIIPQAAAKPARLKSGARVRAMVRQMVAARASQTQLEYLTKTHGSFSIDEAYQIQLALARALSRKLGPIVGYKVAFASKAAQEQFGVDEPASGPLFRLQRLPNGSTLPASAFIEITLETEVAFTICERIDRPIKDVAEIKDYVKWVHTAFDIGDYRFIEGDTKPTPQDMIASGVGAHFFVLGPAMDPSKVDVDGVDLILARNGETITKSPTTNVMGSPWNSLLWCVNHVVKLGCALEPGTVIVTGTAAPAYRVKGEGIQGDYVGDCGPLGKVTMAIK